MEGFGNAFQINDVFWFDSKMIFKLSPEHITAFSAMTVAIGNTVI